MSVSFEDRKLQKVSFCQKFMNTINLRLAIRWNVLLKIQLNKIIKVRGEEGNAGLTFSSVAHKKLRYLVEKGESRLKYQNRQF